MMHISPVYVLLVKLQRHLLRVDDVALPLERVAGIEVEDAAPAAFDPFGRCRAWDS